ncbi:MAG: sulfate adenylyltransferase [Salinarimonadaceae bacterium]|nr:MAG: sulfate adenylyltransferase [Salinarimonadaceae bacterium]
MTIHPAPKSFAPESGALEALVAGHGRKDVLRFITCGSVDDGKSTLIGRLLHDTRQILDDQLVALASESRRHGTQGDELDLALLVDGLAAEREQGITIDVAYRFFSTEKRSFIVADTPGHEQYTRNMATGASTAEAAILLVDAGKGLTAQTRRHALLVSMLGVRHVALAVNKMDLVGWNETAFARIRADFERFAAGLGFVEIVAIPISAKTGDNVARPSGAAPWRAGPTLLEWLETVRPQPEAASAFRMPIQWVCRPNASFRGYAGLVAGGAVSVGDRVRIAPGSRETRIARIVTFDGDLQRAEAGRSVVLTFADEIDAARGDIVAAPEAPPIAARRLRARLFWTGENPARVGSSFTILIGTARAGATITEIVGRIDPGTGAPEPAATIATNDIVDVILALDVPVAADSYAANRSTGGFLMVERETTDTAALGLVTEAIEPREETREEDGVGLFAGAPASAPARRAVAGLATVAIAAGLGIDPAFAALIGLASLGVNEALARI